MRNAVETFVRITPAFASTTELIRVVEYRVFQVAPATIRDVIKACAEHKIYA